MTAPRRRDATFLVLGAACPFLLAFQFVHRFGVNVPAHDEWNFMPTVGAFYTNSGWPALLFDHYGEHRIPVPKAIILGLAPFTRLNVKIEMFLAALLMLAAALICWRLIVLTQTARWTIVPVGWLLLSTAQAENLLVGWQFQIPLMNACAMTAIWRLCSSHPWQTNRFRAWQAGVAALAATFSFANGWMIWPSLVLLSRLRREPLRHALLWSVAGLGALWLYRVGYTGFHRTAGDRAPEYFAAIARDPLGVLALFAGTTGNSFGGASITSYVLPGLVLLGLAVLLTSAALRSFASESAPWISLLVFSLLSSAAIAIGRGQEWRAFLTPLRYLSISIFIPIAVIVLGTRWLHGRTRPSRLTTLLATGCAIAAVWLHLGKVTSAWELAEADRQMKVSARACLLDYRHATDACLHQLYAPDPERVREYSAMLETWHLGPFGRVNTSQCLEPGTIQGTLDVAAFETAGSDLVVSVEGWAVDTVGQELDSVVAEVDGTMVGSTGEFFERPDVSAFFHKPVGRTGWRIRATMAGLSRGRHRVQAIVESARCRQPLPMKIIEY